MIKLFLCGDVMTGRGIDQILPRPSEPTLYEPSLTCALDYVALAERVSGPIPRGVDFDYIWGDALPEMRARNPALRLVNLETSITTSEEPWPKGINYRMHPANIACLQAAGIDCCALANNHVLDWGTAGLLETVDSLSRAGIAAVGAGRTYEEASKPAAFEVDGTRLLIFSFGSTTSSIPSLWAATPARPGVNLLPGLSVEAADRVSRRIHAHKRPGDSVIASIHWGDNWGYAISEAQRSFAHRLIDSGAVDVIHGHSSHHVKAIEVYSGHLIIYGCGDFITDYEGISGHEAYRPDLVAAYFASLDEASGCLESLEIVPFRSKGLRLVRATREHTADLQRILVRQGKTLGTSVRLSREDVLSLRW